MSRRSLITTVGACALVAAACDRRAAARGPIIDMHLERGLE